MIAADLRFEDIIEGSEVEHEYLIDSGLPDRFVDLFHDASPIHVDDEFARRKGFPGRVAHGAIMNGFLSHFVGMVLPGRGALLLSTDIRYVRPAYAGTRVRLRAKVAHRVESECVVVLTCTFEEAVGGEVLARARVQVAVADA
jgi:3-hydroxybutyryl-CoA dehydratase